MLLSGEDVRLLEKAGYDKFGFSRCDKRGYVLLRNRRRYCYFYDVAQRRCKAYSVRPLGCRLYPVICTDENAVIVDDLCPWRDTVTKEELHTKGKKVLDLVQRIDLEAEERAQTMK